MNSEISFQYRQVIEVDLACDNACVFCSQSELRRPFVVDEPLLAEDAEQGGRAGFSDHDEPASSTPPKSIFLEGSKNESSGRGEFPSEVTLVGGEPTLLPDLAERIAAARRQGALKVGVQTHGRHLAAPDTLTKLVDAGLSDLHLSIHGPDPASHDFHTEIEGAFSQVLKTLTLARQYKLPVVVNTVLTPSNYAVLAPLGQTLRQQGVAAWLISVPRVLGEAAKNQQRVIPRLGLAIPYALQALSNAEKLGLPSFIRGAPLCLLGPFVERALPEEEPRSFWEPSCGSCPARQHCPGVDSAYLQRFKGDELSPRSVVPAFRPRNDAEAALARQFVGLGRLSPGASSS